MKQFSARKGRCYHKESKEKAFIMIRTVQKKLLFLAILVTLLLMMLYYSKKSTGNLKNYGSLKTTFPAFF